MSSFLSAKQKVNQWKRIKEIKRSNNDSVPELTQNERISLKVMYELYCSLKKIKDEKITELTRLKENSETNLHISESENSLSSKWTISKALQWIQWDKKMVRVIGGSTQYLEHFDANSWGEWSKNPFINFYESEEIYKSDFQFLNQLRKQIYRERQQQRNNQMQFSNRHSQKQQEETIKKIKSLRDGNYTYRHIEARVAEKLLSEMNQLG